MAQTIAGIYMIQSLIRPERIYVGSAVNLKDRKRLHFYALEKGSHKSQKLQRHYNKYGKEDLVFEVIESGDYFNKQHLLSREQGWFGHFEYKETELPYFNSAKIAGSQQGFKHSAETKSLIAEQSRKRRHLEKSKQKLIGNKNASGKRTLETIENIRQSQIGRKHTQATKDKMSRTRTGKKMSDKFRKQQSERMMGNKIFQGKTPWNKGFKKKEGALGKINKLNINLNT